MLRGRLFAQGVGRCQIGDPLLAKEEVHDGVVPGAGFVALTARARSTTAVVGRPGSKGSPATLRAEGRWQDFGISRDIDALKYNVATSLTDNLAPTIERSEAARLAELLQALGDPTRLRILSILDTACVPVGAIAIAAGLRQPAVSHHLRVLRDRGVVRGERRGAYVYYCAASDELRPALEAARALLKDTSA